MKTAGPITCDHRGLSYVPRSKLPVSARRNHGIIQDARPPSLCRRWICISHAGSLRLRMGRQRLPPQRGHRCPCPRCFGDMRGRGLQHTEALDASVRGSPRKSLHGPSEPESRAPRRTGWFARTKSQQLPGLRLRRAVFKRARFLPEF